LQSRLENGKELWSLTSSEKAQEPGRAFFCLVDFWRVRREIAFSSAKIKFFEGKIKNGA
jgi:hypothetical protein